ncbi:MAG: TRAFs-binding domain-containing protein [Rubripirellula sp.]|nr:TRAFs-binding domain-containing protein [Rubripirellula sp.]
MTYIPMPLDTHQFPLSADIEELIDTLAFHAHEAWAERKIAEGWTYGSERDDLRKQHPCLMPYSELEESETLARRKVAAESVKAILALGYRITPGPTRTRATASHEAIALTSANELIQQLQQAQADSSELELAVLLQIWNARRDDDRAWFCQPDLYRQISRRFLKLGEAPLAREVALTALELSDDDERGEPFTPWDQDVELRQIYGLALARSGSPVPAQKVLTKLGDEGHVDQETLGILARTYKDQAFSPGIAPERRRQLLEASLERYRSAYQLTAGFWTGINVATLLRLLDAAAESERIATQVKSQCQADLDRVTTDGATAEQTYWHWATLGEVALNQGDFEEAGRHYGHAQSLAKLNYGDLNVTRRHARWLLDYWIHRGDLQEEDRGRLAQWLPISPVVVFSGHMIDAGNRQRPRFPDAASADVDAAIRRWLVQQQAFIGYSSAACGADLLFQKAIQDLGGESRIVLPFDVEPFRQLSVAFAGQRWNSLFDDVIDNATQVIIASPQRTQGDGIAFEYANLVLHGLATLRATELQGENCDPIGLAVWDGKPGQGRGGTAHVIKQWQDLGMEVHQIDVSRYEDSNSSLPSPPAPAVELSVLKNPPGLDTQVFSEGDETTDTRVMAMLFGDAVNFSQLDEHQVSQFIEHFMHPIGNIIRGYGEANVVRNTWGDGIYLVFDHVREAGLCALEMCEFTRQQIAQNAWKKHRLPENLNVRVALHAGPVFGCVDPITGTKNYTGTHVSRAARLEPKTPPGEVYASEAFAALCSQYRVREFNCEYVKQLAWAKHYGSFPTFVIRPTAPIESVF